MTFLAVSVASYTIFNILPPKQLKINKKIQPERSGNTPFQTGFVKLLTYDTETGCFFLKNRLITAAAISIPPAHGYTRISRFVVP